MDNTEFAKRSETISTLSMMFGRPFPVTALKSFLMATEDISLAKFMDGAAKATRECRFMPCPAEFRELSIGKKSRIQPLPKKAIQ